MQGWASLFRGRRTPSQRGTHRRPHRRKASVKTVASETPDLTTPDVDKLDPTKEDDKTKQQPAQPLGVQHLGKFAHEDEMPGWLVEKLARDGQVCTHDVIPALTKLVAKSRTVSYAYFCHPCVQHVSKLRREGEYDGGGFCGYRNIQALISYIIGARTPGHQHFSNGLPSVLEIQDLIESAWDSGHNSSGRLETGGIRRTRKFIGTPEAQAFFKGLKIPCSVTAFRPAVTGTAWKDMMVAIEIYFAQGWAAELGSKVRLTNRPPVYLQHHGHSLTVVGFEKDLGGASCLYVFDPSNRDPGAMKTKISRGSKHVDTKSDALIDVYRRGEAYLCKYSEFEVLLQVIQAAVF